ncbi:MAG: hypothetical protein HYZ75_08405 [Elusimicrobia bacterium]|nr:hypothetical protein [Elusimicrobiota bacterium]
MPILLISLLLAALPSLAYAKVVSNEMFLDHVRRAQVRVAVDPSTLDLRNGPQGPGTYPLGAEVGCKYEEKDSLHPLGGHSPKFPCVTPDGRRLKVKYKGEANPEVYGEVVGARLLWALGFYADSMSSVKIMCENCPADPWTATASSPRNKRAFEPATVQERLKGAEIERAAGEAWTFGDLDLVNPELGGASRADTDALKLLAAFMNHGDNTANQQRLVCLEGDPECKSPAMYITDVGGVFGGKGYFTSYKHWTRRPKLWKDSARCVLDFSGTDNKYKDPVISEGGRKLLADLLGKLSESQVKDLFLGARFDHLARREPPFIGANGKSRPLTVDDWVKAFIERRSQITGVRCPQ